MKNKKNRIFNLIKYIFSLFLILLILLNINTKKGKTIDKEKIDALKPLDQEGQNYRLVTSADNVQVPVPKGYVASQVTGENYVTPQYQHTTITHKISTTPTELTWSSPEGEQYPWTQDSNGIWISGNQGIPNSESVLESEEFDYVKGTTLTIKYTYSSQSSYDYLYIELINITNNMTRRMISKSGNIDASFDYTTSNYEYTINDWGTGRYKIRIIYSKNGSIDQGQDSGYIKASTYYKVDENGTRTIEEDIKTKIHDGGFVIYQLTDEELETDPNGTSVDINDTNKYEAQTTRNQYVWVPVNNIEDIQIIKEANNGIMQFGQGYEFNNKPIKKNTNSSNEPRMAEENDKTKYYLQKYSNINKRENYLNKMQEDFARLIKSVNKYKGFYIGRYETGDDYTHNSNKRYFTNPRVVRYNENINYVTWYDSYKTLERLSGETEKYVETGMLYDSLFDYTLKWLNGTDTRSYEEITNAGTWGNYRESIKTVQSGSTSLANTGAIETLVFKGERFSDSPTSSNNIFDIAGNVREWTRTRKYGRYRDIRGGDYSLSGYISAYSSGEVSPYDNRDCYGTRSMLLIR